MTAQDNNLAISQPAFLAEIAQVTLISEKEKKKQQEELLKLVAALKTVEESLAKGKSAAANGGKIVPLQGPNSNGDEGPSNTAFEDAMAEMALALQTLQVTISKYSEKKAGFDANISQQQVAMAKESLQKAIDQLNKIQNESFWEKLVGWIVAVVSAIAAVVTMNPELLLITVISVLAATGMMSKITQGIADVLEDIGVPKDVANAIAAAIVVVIVLICTLGTGEAAAAEVAVDSAEDGVEMSNMAASGVEDAAEGAATDASSFSDKASALFKKINPFSRLSTKANTVILGAVQSIASTGLINNLAELIMAHAKVSAEERKKVEEILGMIVAIVAIIVSIGASAGAIGKAAGDMSENLAKFQQAVFRVGGFVQFAGGATEGGLNIARGVFEKDLAIINANMALIQTAINMNNTVTTDDQKHDADVIKQQNVGNRSLSKLMDGEKGFADLFTQNSPV